jgi:hypothetical protein
MIENLSLNFSVPNDTFSHIDNLFNNMTCVLNQQAMMHSTNNLYKFSFYLSILTLLVLIFFFWIQPRFKVLDELLELEPVRFVLGLNIFITLILLYTNSGFSEQTLLFIQKLLWGILIVLGLAIGYQLYKKYVKEARM